ncbi:hypothetical protein ACLO87_15955 [Paenalcaligenes sp. Me52]|uniref:type II secretion system protein N n=1 Tax=Paenalcaligenes sp. Me52 TaxID=3392038 RepID=UPI003D2BA060
MARWIQRLMVVIAAAVAGYGTAYLAAPTTLRFVPLAATHTVLQGMEADAVASWFGTAGGPVRILIQGVMSSSQPNQGAALLSIDGAPAQAYRNGDWLADGVRLVVVGPRSIQVEQQGARYTVEAPQEPVAVLQEAIRVVHPAP